LFARDREKMHENSLAMHMKAHPIFKVMAGKTESWEKKQNKIGIKKK